MFYDASIKFAISLPATVSVKPAPSYQKPDVGYRFARNGARYVWFCRFLDRFKIEYRAVPVVTNTKITFTYIIYFSFIGGMNSKCIKNRLNRPLRRFTIITN